MSRGTLIVVVEVASGSIAEKICIHPNAVIQQIDNNNAISSIDDLTKNLKTNLGKTIAIKWTDVRRDLKQSEVKLPASAESGRGILGIALTSIDPSHQKQLVFCDYLNAAIAHGAGTVLLLAGRTMKQTAVSSVH